MSWVKVVLAVVLASIIMLPSAELSGFSLGGPSSHVTDHTGGPVPSESVPRSGMPSLVTHAAAASFRGGQGVRGGPRYVAGGSPFRVANPPYDPASGYSIRTLVIPNDTLLPGAPFLPQEAENPQGAVYDVGRGDVYVMGYGDHVVGVISASSRLVMHNVNVGADPVDGAYDSGKGEIFVTDFGSNQVTVVNDTTNSVVANITVGAKPDMAAYVSALSEIFVSNSGSNSLSVISDQNNSVIRTVTLPITPFGLTYDSGQKVLFISDAPGDTVGVLSVANYSMLATITVGGAPWSMTYDSARGEIYVANQASVSDNVSVINDTKWTVVAWVNVGSDPLGVAYDPARGEVFVANDLSDTVSVISDTNNTVVATVPVQAQPQVPVYVPAAGDLFVPDFEFSMVSVISDASNQVSDTIYLQEFPFGATYDGSVGDIYVDDSVSGDLVAISGTSQLAVANYTTASNYGGYFPVTGSPCYDSRKGEIFVASYTYDSVMAISDANGSLIANISMGTDSYGNPLDPVTIACDSGNGEVYVIGGDNLNTGEWYNVSVISDSTDTVVANISIGGGGPLMNNIAYDSGKGEIFVYNASGHGGAYSYVSVISDKTNTVTSTIPVNTSCEANPSGMVYDPGRGEVFMAGAINGFTDGLEWINDSTHAVRCMPGLNTTGAMTYDNATGEIYLGMAGYRGTSNVSVLSDATNTIIENLSVGDQNASVTGLAYDPQHGFIYVVGGDPGSVSIIAQGPKPGGPTITSFTASPPAVPVGKTAYLNVTTAGGVPPLHYVYTGLPQGCMTADQPSLPCAPTAPGGFLVRTYVNDSASHSANATVALVVKMVYPVTFTESGLPSGTSWSVTLNGTAHTSTSSSLTFSAPNGTYNYSVANIPGYTVFPSAGTAIISGAPLGVTVTYTSIPPGSYMVTFNETGLPTGTNWAVTLNGNQTSNTGPTITFTEKDGTYNYTVGVPVGYTAAPSSGSVTVVGKAVGQNVTFTKSSGPTQYTVTFTESGLPSGTAWSVILNGTTKTSTTTTLTFSEPNGTYSYTVVGVSGYTSTPSSGSITVNRGPTGASITFTAMPAGSYSVTFSETGLPAAANWSVSLAGKTMSATGSTISFTEKNGTYNYTVTGPAGYTASPPIGSLTVAGKAISQSLTFTKSSTKATYAVTFTESGLPSGTSWSATLNGSSQSSTTATITFSEANGSYAFTVRTVNGYSVNPTTGTVKVDGSSTGRAVTFTGSTPSNNKSTGFLGFPGDDGYVVIGVVVVAVAVATAVLLKRRRGKSPQKPTGLTRPLPVEAIAGI